MTHKRYCKIDAQTLLKIDPQTLLKIDLQLLFKIDPQLLLKTDPQALPKKWFTTVTLKLIHKRYSKIDPQTLM